MDAIYTGKKISSLLRKEKNFTQKDLAEKLHVSHNRTCSSVSPIWIPGRTMREV